MKQRESKIECLRRLVRETGGMVVAFSGLDSTLLALVAAQELGRKALAVTVLSSLYPAAEQKEAARLARRIGIRHVVIRPDVLKIQGVVSNPPDRCYHCKKALCVLFRKVADKAGIAIVADGTNTSDKGDYRPGHRAAVEAGIRSPLLEAGLGKDEIRKLSRRLGLSTADKPSMACLASRFPYGVRLTEKGLRAVDSVEQAVRGLGVRQVRVRHHGSVARVEVEAGDIGRLVRPEARRVILKAARKAGYRYAAVDLAGYSTGSLNALLDRG